MEQVEIGISGWESSSLKSKEREKSPVVGLTCVHTSHTHSSRCFQCGEMLEKQRAQLMIPSAYTFCISLRKVVLNFRWSIDSFFSVRIVCMCTRNVCTCVHKVLSTYVFVWCVCVAGLIPRRSSRTVRDVLFAVAANRRSWLALRLTIATGSTH